MKTKYNKIIAIALLFCIMLCACTKDENVSPVQDTQVNNEVTNEPSATEDKDTKEPSDAAETADKKSRLIDKLKSIKTLNYKKIESWALFDDSQSAPVDVFFLAPTIDNGADGDNNIRFSGEGADQIRTSFNSAVLQEVGIYNQNANVYAPYYNQVTYRVYSLGEKESRKYFNKSYAGVRKAFKLFLKRTGDRPFIIAGFSQGSQMALGLLEEFMDSKKVAKRLVAAYLIGWRVTDEDLENYPHLKMATGEGDTGVIISYNSEADFVDNSIMVPKGTFTYGINPLNWMTDSTPADKSLNKGGCFMDTEGVITQEIPEITGAYLDETRGTLKCTDINPADYNENGIYHDCDFRFFYRNLQENVLVRTENYLNEKAK